jgi:ubiquitin-activating enzyme E1
MIGAGALGCEFLKVFSLMGIASDDKNKHKYTVTVTDNDNIVESNLNRQFLFRKENIGKSKSKVACQSVKKINPSFNCVDLQARIGSENEEKFNEKFWKKHDFVINAVDNVEARKFISKKCKMYGKILIDSGTNGTKANSQIIIPYETIDYSPPKINQENQIPMCTLRNFPTSIEHCIEWARDKFDGYFINIINEVKSFIEDKDKFYNELSKEMVPSDQIEKIKEISRYVKIIINKDFEECLKIGFEEYNKSYNDSINLILKNNPPNSLNKDGTKFWSGNKRCPNLLPFNIDKKLTYILSKK